MIERGEPLEQNDAFLRVRKERLEKTARFLGDIEAEMIIPLHCTGLRESAYLQRRLDGVVKFLGAGDTLPIISP
jgi:metal-dependent hydrolase (beta-lactamase superfamily II)